MAFFKGSFENLGETLRTVGLVIGLFVTSMTGIGYVYQLISDQKALASTVTSVSARVETLEKQQVMMEVDRHRLLSVETNTREMGTKLDRILEALALGSKRR